MKANELRIGNWVDFYDNGATKIETALQIHLDHKHYEPIPLTEYWLERFGSTDAFGRLVFDNIELVQSGGDPFLWEVWYDWEYADKKVLIAEIKYVHQLQNLYFALTGEELEIKK